MSFRLTTLLTMAACIHSLASSVVGQSSTRSPNFTPPGSSSRAVPVQQQRADRSTYDQSSAAHPVRLRQQKQAARQPTFEDKLWNFIVDGKYRNWAPVPGKSDAMYEGQSPHGAHLKMYLNRKAAGNAATLPNRSIVIKENYDADRRTLMAITVMFRSSGYNAAAGDWYWVKYLPNGQVAQKDTANGRLRLAGKVNGCIECHREADGDDFVFFNDE